MSILDIKTKKENISSNDGFKMQQQHFSSGLQEQIKDIIAPAALKVLLLF